MDKDYNENYYRGCCGNVGCGMDYSNRDYWAPRFKEIAESIVKEFNPKTFIDVGCAYGYLVEGLRDLGVEAYGVDISKYAISQARDDIKEYLFVADFTKELPAELHKKFDCASTIEVIEHVKEEYTDDFLSAFCNLADVLIFSSSPTDITEKTHVNVQQPEYWCKRFADKGFFRDLYTNPLFISVDEMVFIKKDVSIRSLVEDYEHYIRLLKMTEIGKRDEWLQMKIDEIKTKDDVIKHLESVITQFEEDSRQKERILEEVKKSQSELFRENQDIKNSKLFKMTGFLRK